MYAFDAIAERRILQAIARGELDGLPGAGKPLALDDDAMVPEETRVAYRILKNAGFVPAGILDASGRARTLARLAVLRARLFEKRTRVGLPSRIRGRR